MFNRRAAVQRKWRRPCQHRQSVAISQSQSIAFAQVLYYICIYINVARSLMKSHATCVLLSCTPPLWLGIQYIIIFIILILIRIRHIHDWLEHSQVYASRIKVVNKKQNPNAVGPRQIIKSLQRVVGSAGKHHNCFRRGLLYFEFILQ